MSNDPRGIFNTRHARGSSAIPEQPDPRPLPRGGGPDPDDKSGTTAEQRGRELHEANLAVQRRSRIESRRRKIGWLRGHVFPEGSRFAEQYAREIAQLESDIRADGEEP